jgi:hypothetical protein
MARTARFQVAAVVVVGVIAMVLFCLQDRVAMAG